MIETPTQTNGWDEISRGCVTLNTSLFYFQPLPFFLSFFLSTFSKRKGASVSLSVSGTWIVCRPLARAGPTLSTFQPCMPWAPFVIPRITRTPLSSSRLGPGQTPILLSIKHPSILICSGWIFFFCLCCISKCKHWLHHHRHFYRKVHVAIRIEIKICIS